MTADGAPDTRDAHDARDAPDGPSTDGPSTDLDDDLELDVGDWDTRQMYFLLTGLVVPRPIAWISTVAADGTRNLAPHSYFNLVAHDPPHVVFGESRRKDTLANIEATREFVVNLATEHVLEQMNASAVDAPPEVDEFDLVGVTAAPSHAVAPPRVAEAVGHLECRMTHHLELGSGHLVVGEVVHVHVARDVWREGRVAPELLRPVLRFAGSMYGTIGELFRLPRPSWARDVADHEKGDRSWIPRREG